MSEKAAAAGGGGSRRQGFVRFDPSSCFYNTVHGGGWRDGGGSRRESPSSLPTDTQAAPSKSRNFRMGRVREGEEGDESNNLVIALPSFILTAKKASKPPSLSSFADRQRRAKLGRGKRRGGGKYAAQFELGGSRYVFLSATIEETHCGRLALHERSRRH